MAEILNDLLEIGMTEYEAKVYQALLQQETISASDLVLMSGVPRGRIYDVINQLISKGFCITILGTIKKFKAEDPETAIKNLIEQEKKKEVLMLEIARNLQAKYNNKKESPATFDYINVLTSKQSQINKFQELEESAKKFILTFNKKPYVIITASMKEIRSFSEPQRKIIKRGVKTKGIYEADSDTDENFEIWIRYFEEIGEEVRICRELPLKMLISDESKVMLSLHSEHHDKFNLLSMVVEHSDLTNALIKLFYFYWNSSYSIDEYFKLKKFKKIKK